MNLLRRGPSARLTRPQAATGLHGRYAIGDAEKHSPRRLPTMTLRAGAPIRFGLVFLRLRRPREMSRRPLAEKAHVAPSHIREVESGRKALSAAAVVKLAHGLSISELVALSLFRVIRRFERSDRRGRSDHGCCTVIGASTKLVIVRIAE